jgi:hypothetical protein
VVLVELPFPPVLEEVAPLEGPVVLPPLEPVLELAFELVFAPEPEVVAAPVLPTMQPANPAQRPSAREPLHHTRPSLRNREQDRGWGMASSCWILIKPHRAANKLLWQDGWQEDC